MERGNLSQNAKVSSSKNQRRERSSSPTPSENDSLFQPASPLKLANTKISMKSNQREKLKDIENRCLITNGAEPKAAIQVCHIVRRRIIGKDTTKLEKMWSVADFDVDTTKNLVTLRADWHLAFDANTWAFVPTQEVLNKILENPEGTFDRPYRGYTKMTNYIFVPFPELGLDYINRADFGGTSFQTYQMDEKFGGFPILMHHSHPYCVIYNALPKFRDNADVLTEEQVQLLDSMQVIFARWKRRLSNSPGRPLPTREAKRKRGDSDGEASDEETVRGNAEKKKKDKQSQAPAAKTLKNAEAGQNIRDIQAGQLSTPSQSQWSTSPASDPLSYEDRINAISAWINNVCAAGPSKEVLRSAIRKDGEVARAGCADWHSWGVSTSWTLPARHDATSNDWAIINCGFFLTKPLVNSGPEESEHSSDGSSTE